MSLQSSKYQTDIPNGDTTAYIAKIRVSTKTLELTIAGQANTPPAGAIDFPISAKVSANVRAKGLRPTIVVLRATGTIGDYTSAAVVRVPLLNTTIKNNASIATSATAVSYGGTTSWVVSYVEEERHK